MLLQYCKHKSLMLQSSDKLQMLGKDGFFVVAALPGDASII